MYISFHSVKTVDMFLYALNAEEGLTYVHASTSQANLPKGAQLDALALMVTSLRIQQCLDSIWRRPCLEVTVPLATLLHFQLQQHGRWLLRGPEA